MHEEFLKINRFWIAQTEHEICTIIRTSVDKTCFPGPVTFVVLDMNWYMVKVIYRSILSYVSEHLIGTI